MSIPEPKSSSVLDDDIFGPSKTSSKPPKKPLADVVDDDDIFGAPVKSSVKAPPTEIDDIFGETPKPTSQLKPAKAAVLDDEVKHINFY